MPALGWKATLPGKRRFIWSAALPPTCGGDGHALGPDLASVRSSGPETILINLLDPNRQVAPNYMRLHRRAKDGESWLGLVANETAASVTVRQANDIETVILRANIQRMQSQGQSVMPEGLEAGLTAQGLADLLQYITTAEEPRKVKPQQASGSQETDSVVGCLATSWNPMTCAVFCSAWSFRS